MSETTGTLFGVGVGPGDPELLTLKAVRIIQSSPVIAYLVNHKGTSQAREIAAEWLTGAQREIPIPMMFQTDRGRANAAYDEAAIGLQEVLASGQDAAVLCEGDPLLFGSFAYLHQRLAERFPCTVIPGITSVAGAAAAATTVLATGDDRLAIVPATADEERLRRALCEYDSVVVMKPGRHRLQVLQALRETGRLDDTLYVEQATRRNQRVIRRVGDMAPTPGPYFALFLVTRGSGS